MRVRDMATIQVKRGIWALEKSFLHVRGLQDVKARKWRTLTEINIVASRLPLIIWSHRSSSESRGATLRPRLWRACRPESAFYRIVSYNCKIMQIGHIESSKTLRIKRNIETADRNVSAADSRQNVALRIDDDERRHAGHLEATRKVPARSRLFLLHLKCFWFKMHSWTKRAKVQEERRRTWCVEWQKGRPTSRRAHRGNTHEHRPHT